MAKNTALYDLIELYILGVGGNIFFKQNRMSYRNIVNNCNCLFHTKLEYIRQIVVKFHLHIGFLPFENMCCRQSQIKR